MPGPIDPQLTSVVMVTYYAGQVLDKAIDAVLAQTSPVELIVVNNGSTKAVEAQLAEWAKREPRLKIVSGQGDIGRGAGNNLGAQTARGGFLLFIHPETLLQPNAVETLRNKGDKIKGSYVIGARVLDKNGEERPESRREILTPLVAFAEKLWLTPYLPKYRLSLAREPLPEKISEVPAVSGACMFMPSKDFTWLKGFGKKFHEGLEDMDFCLRLRRAEGKAYFAPDVVAEKQPEGDGPFDLELEKRKIRGFVHYFHENFGHAYPQPVLWLLDILYWARLVKPWLLAYMAAKGLKRAVS